MAVAVAIAVEAVAIVEAVQSNTDMLACKAATAVEAVHKVFRLCHAHHSLLWCLMAGGPPALCAADAADKMRHIKAQKV
jgi:hypothetical protein